MTCALFGGGDENGQTRASMLAESKGDPPDRRIWRRMPQVRWVEKKKKPGGLIRPMSCAQEAEVDRSLCVAFANEEKKKKKTGGRDRSRQILGLSAHEAAEGAAGGGVAPKGLA